MLGNKNTNKIIVKIVVVGTSGVGKSSLSQEISSILNIKHIELDRLYWLPHWKNVSDQTFRNNIDNALPEGSWVACGNHGNIRDYLWSKANVIIWLDYSFPIIFCRAITRTFKRIVLKKECCNGNYEGLKQAFCSKHSILLHVLKTYKRRKREYGLFMRTEKYSHLKFIKLTSTKETKKWIDDLSKEKRPENFILQA